MGRTPLNVQSFVVGVATGMTTVKVAQTITGNYVDEAESKALVNSILDTFIKYNKARHGDDLDRDWITVHLSWDTYDSGWQGWIQMWSDELDEWSTMIEAEIVSSKMQALRALDRRVKELLEDVLVHPAT